MTTASYSHAAHGRTACVHRARAVQATLDRRAGSPLEVPLVTVILGGLLVALAVLSLAIVLTDLF